MNTKQEILLTDHELALAFPPLKGEEYDRLKNDIKENGQREAITTYQGKIVDGRNRYRACKDLGIDPIVEEWDGVGSLVSFVASKNLHRRHLSEGQRAMIVATLKPHFEGEARERMRAGKGMDPGANLPQGRTRDQLAKISHVSPRTIDAASKVLEDGAPELVESVRAGKVSVSAASALASLPHDEQREAVAGGKAKVSAKAKEARSRKPKQDRTNADKELPPAGPETKPEVPDQVMVRKADRPLAIARALVGLLGEERAAEVRDALAELTLAVLEPAGAETD
jgi:ParB-like chromosome segregation protein Spo0J